jgi:RNase P subunit RPR2
MCCCKDAIDIDTVKSLIQDAQDCNRCWGTGSRDEIRKDETGRSKHVSVTCTACVGTGERMGEGLRKLLERLLNAKS